MTGSCHNSSALNASSTSRATSLAEIESYLSHLVSLYIDCLYDHFLCCNLYNKRRYVTYVCLFVCLFVCLYLCSVWPAKRLGRSRRNLTHALMSTQGVFLSRSFMYACGSDSITKHPERCSKATPGERLRNSVRTTGNYSSSNEARRRS